jgi:RNA polymerase sigma-70 factor (family 1)
MPTGNKEIDTLLSNIQNDNHFAFSRLFDLYKAKVYNFAYKFVLTEDNADEITQIVFIKLWENRKKLNITTSFDSFLYVLTKNTCFDFLRKVVNDKKLLDSFITTYQYYLNNDNVEDSIRHQEFISCTEEIIEKLPPKQKEVFTMSVFDKKSYGEIAKIMNISINTVKTQLKLAKLFVRKNVASMDKTTIVAIWLLLL